MKDSLFLLLISTILSLTTANDNNLSEIFNKGNDQFSGKMLNKVFDEMPGKSAVMSAFSVLTPLGLLAAASKGSTRDELLSAMGFPHKDVMKSSFSLIIEEIKSVEGIELKIANRIFIPSHYELNSKFASDAQTDFNSEVIKVDFSQNDILAASVNKWAAEATNGRIKDIISPDSISGDPQALLVNAIYFKGIWKEKFHKESTYNRTFHNTKKTKIEVPMMEHMSHYKYSEISTLNTTILEIPYTGEQSSMVILLPDEIDGIENLIRNLQNSSALEEINSATILRRVHVTIPKFKIETSINLKDALQKMNIKELFSVKADLSDLLTNSRTLYVSDATQKAFIEVNEEGTEAAATNVLRIRTKSAHNRVRRFLADHPFVFLIKINKTIIFSGVYYG